MEIISLSYVVLRSYHRPIGFSNWKGEIQLYSFLDTDEKLSPGNL